MPLVQGILWCVSVGQSQHTAALVLFIVINIAVRRLKIPVGSKLPNTAPLLVGPSVVRLLQQEWLVYTESALLEKIPFLHTVYTFRVILNIYFCLKDSDIYIYFYMDAHF